MLKKTRPLLELVRIAAQRFREDRCMQIASSLTFTTLLSLVPLVTVAFTLISAFPVFATLTGHLEEFVMKNLLPQSAELVATYAGEFTANAARLTAVGVSFLAATAIMMLATIERAFNVIWRVSQTRSVMQRVLIYWTLVTVGPVLIGASLSLTSWLVSVSLGWVRDIPGAGVALLKIVPIVLTALALSLLYLTMPHRRVRIRDAVVGGLCAGLAFEFMKRAFAFYITQFPTYKLVYGAFASFPIFLIWIYLSWLVVLGGAVVVAVLPEWHAGSSRRPRLPGGDFFEALQILRVLWHAQRTGEFVDPRRLHRVVKAPIERVEAILDTMSAAMWVSRTLPVGWVLSRDPDTIRVEEVYRLFVFRPDSRVPAQGADAALDALAHGIAARIGEIMQMSIERLFETVVSTDAPATPAREEAPRSKTA